MGENYFGIDLVESKNYVKSLFKLKEVIDYE